MKIEIKSIVNGGSRATVFAGRHIHGFLFALLIMAIGAWGFIFWQYGYLVVFQQEDVTARPFNIKERELKTLLEKDRDREEFQKTIADKQFPNPFVKFPEVQ